MTTTEIRIKVRQERDGLYTAIATARGYPPAQVTGFGSRAHAYRGSFIAEGDLRRLITAQNKRA